MTLPSAAVTTDGECLRRATMPPRVAVAENPEVHSRTFEERRHVLREQGFERCSRPAAAYLVPSSHPTKPITYFNIDSSP